MAKWAKRGTVLAVVLVIAAGAVWVAAAGMPGGGGAPAGARGGGGESVAAGVGGASSGQLPGGGAANGPAAGREPAGGGEAADGAMSGGVPATAAGATATPTAQTAPGAGSDDGEDEPAGTQRTDSGVATPEATPPSPAEPVAEPTPTPTPTPEATATPEAAPAPDPTPEPSLEPTPVAPTPAPTTDPTPAPTPAPASAAGNASVIEGLWNAVRGIATTSYKPSPSEIRDLRKQERIHDLEPRSVCVAVRYDAIHDGWQPVPGWLTTEEFRSVAAIAAAAWNARIEPDPFPGSVPDCPAGASLAGGWVPVWFSTEPASRGAVGLFDYGKGAMVGLEQPHHCLVPAGTIAHELGHALGLRDRNARIQEMMSHYRPDRCSIVPSEREAAVARHLVFGVAEIADRIRPRAELIRDALGEASGPGFYPRLEDGSADQLVYWRPCYPGEDPCTAEVVAAALEATSCRRITKWFTMESTVAGDHWLWPFYDALAARNFGEWPTYTASVWHGWFDSIGDLDGGKVVVEWVDYWREPHMYRVTCA